jgi:glucokinase
MENIESDPRPILPVVLGVDVGGSKVAAALVDQSGSLFGLVRRATEHGGPKETLDGISQVIGECIESSGIPRSQVLGVGLGIPGLVDPEQGIGIASVNLGWRDVPVRDELQKRTGLPCGVENDVRAAALGEARFGAGRQAALQVFLVIGTGIAATLVQDKRIYRGAHNLAGEIGHAVLDPQGPRCKCGARGCFEALAAGPAIAARYLQKLTAAGGSSNGDQTGADGKVTAENVFQKAEAGDLHAISTILDTAEDVAHALQFLALAYDPDVIVLAGGVTKAGSAFLTPVRGALERRSQSNLVLGRMYTADLIQVTQLGREIGVLGAAALVAPAEWSFELSSRLS